MVSDKHPLTHASQLAVFGEAGSLRVATIHGYLDQIPANAHLIASAPDLYAALEELTAAYAWVLKHGCRSGLPEGPTMYTARAALAKARGMKGGE